MTHQFSKNIVLSPAHSFSLSHTQVPLPTYLCTFSGQTNTLSLSLSLSVSHTHLVDTIGIHSCPRNVCPTTQMFSSSKFNPFSPSLSLSLFILPLFIMLSCLFVSLCLIKPYYSLQLHLFLSVCLLVLWRLVLLCNSISFCLSVCQFDGALFFFAAPSLSFSINASFTTFVGIIYCPNPHPVLVQSFFLFLPLIFSSLLRLLLR